MKELIIIYDFDGTLTPYAYPQYEILNKCGYDEEKMKKLVSQFANKGNDIYLSYMFAIYDIFERFNIPRDMSVFYDSALNVKFNNDVFNYFERFNNEKIKHYVVTSGFKSFVLKTLISKFLTDVYGTTVTSDYDFEHKEIMTDVKKVDAIKEIIKLNGNNNNVIYIGDGLTDEMAFKYVHDIGGFSILVYSDIESESYKFFKNKDYIDRVCLNEFSVNSLIDRTIKKSLVMIQES